MGETASIWGGRPQGGGEASLSGLGARALAVASPWPLGALDWSAPPCECTCSHIHTGLRTGVSHSRICHPPAWGVQCLRGFRVAQGPLLVGRMSQTVPVHSYCPSPPWGRKTAPLTPTTVRIFSALAQPPAQSPSRRAGPGSHAAGVGCQGLWPWEESWMGVGAAGGLRGLGKEALVTASRVPGPSQGPGPRALLMELHLGQEALQPLSTLGREQARDLGGRGQSPQPVGSRAKL